jgi:hypothetical protein
VFVAFFILPMWVATALGVLTTIASGVYSLRTISSLVSLERVPVGLLALLTRCHLVVPLARA